MKRIIYYLFIILLVSITLISIIFIYKELKQNKEYENTFKELSEIIENDNENNEDLEEKINLTKLYNLNNDFVGWIRIEDTNINYPVMQSKNNPNYYLKKDFYKKNSSYGTPYISEQCDINRSENLIIYGHHISENKMFGELENYKSKEFYNNHSVIKFSTLEETHMYQIFAVFKTVVYNNSGFRYYDYIELENNQAYTEFINKCNELSLYQTNKEPIYKDKLITLSTCEYSNKNGRLVIVAYEL